ncbi:hypothetical protein JM66_13725 [Aeromonas bestiarum]|nr:hypothetical protein JM66_13725 [Aeromonas bestiarum]
MPAHDGGHFLWHPPAQVGDMTMAASLSTLSPAGVLFAAPGPNSARQADGMTLITPMVFLR